MLQLTQYAGSEEDGRSFQPDTQAAAVLPLQLQRRDAITKRASGVRHTNRVQGEADDTSNALLHASFCCLAGQCSVLTLRRVWFAD